MSEMGSATTYIPENLRPTRTTSYAAFLNENNFTLLKPGKQDSAGLLQGPRRVLRLCLFALVLPTVLITIPLYVRLVLYSPGHYPMMPTDQRIISRHVSSIWCQSQSTHMNGSFITYQSPDTPTLKNERQRHVMLHSTILRDDIKEYWGFHLLGGSKVTISTCSSREGAQLMILRGIDNLRRCAWIGEEDSAEEEEEEEAGEGEVRKDKNITSTMNVTTSKQAPEYIEDETDDSEMEIDPASPDFQNMKTIDTIPDEPTYYDEQDESEERRQHLQQLIQQAMKMSKDKKELLRILHSVGRGGKKPIPKNIKQMMGATSDELNASPETVVPLNEKKTNKKKSITNSSSETSKLRLTRSAKQEIDEYDGAFEEIDEDDTSKTNEEPKNNEGKLLGHIFYPEGLKFERGKFNQTNKGDKSDEEDHSSYSSSEEALASCEGVILTLPLVAYRSCSYQWMEMNKITYDIPVTGTYYFVYSSDNEIDTNTIYLNMTFERVVYDIDQSVMVCSNTTDCSVPLSFWSSEKTVVEVPQEDSWNNSYTLDTNCEPRVAVYLLFLLLVPILILFCAFQ